MDVILIVALMVAGFGIGAAANLLADWLPEYHAGDVLACPACHARQKVAAYFGKYCPYCQAHNPKRRWLLPVAAAVVFGAAGLLPFPVPGWLVLPLGLVLLLVVVTDMEQRLIKIPCVIAVLLLSWATGAVTHHWLAATISTVFCFIVFLLYFWLAKLMSRRKLAKGEDPVGLGDVLLAGALGGLFYLQGAFLFLLIASVAGAVGGLVLYFVRNRPKGGKIDMPYAPFIVFGAIVVYVVTVAG